MLLCIASVAQALPPTCTTDADCTTDTFCGIDVVGTAAVSYCFPLLGSGEQIPYDHGSCDAPCTAASGCTGNGDAGRVCQGGICDVNNNTCGIASGLSCPADPNRCSHSVCNVHVSPKTCAQPNGDAYCADNTWCVNNNCDPQNNRCGYRVGSGPCGSDPNSSCAPSYYRLTCNSASNTCAWPNLHLQWPVGGVASCQSDDECEVNLCDPDNNFCGYGSGFGSCSDANAATVCAFGVCGPLSRKCMNQRPDGCARDIDCRRFSGQNFCWWGRWHCW
ncbi:MAG: hypothetical protein EOO40_04200 [Deltaproteobacteria bacterium]|nr:MAG: hypothetical protein EOO40_04200 [Deltaproteobacteria bacterium]